MDSTRRVEKRVGVIISMQESIFWIEDCNCHVFVW
jgi:hypothetical protein